MDIFETLTALEGSFGPSGQENDIRKTIEELAKPYADDMTTDVMGNLIVHKKGNGPKVMLAAHMDSIGLMVTHIEDSGLLRVGKIGGVSPRDVLAVPVHFQNGTLGTVYEDEELEDAKREMGHLYVDIGADSKEAALERVQVGDVAIYNTPTVVSGKAVFSPYLDNRICCVALLKALELVKNSENDLYFVFTVQEEVGLRGAGPAAFAIDPDYAVVVDVTPDGSAPGSKHGCSSHCGGGAAIKVMDSSVICHPQMVTMLRELAQAGNIPYQMDVISAGGTDGGAIHRSRAGVVTGGVSVPCKYVHSPQEASYVEDVDATAQLLAALCQKNLAEV